MPAQPAPHARTPETDPDWIRLAGELRQLCLRLFGYEPVAVTLHAAHERLDRTLPVAGARGPAAPAAASPANWASGPEPRHLSDFQGVYWPALRAAPYRLTPKQRPVVKLLWQEMQAGRHEVSQARLLAAAGSEGPRLADLFKGSEAWGTLIVPGGSPGYYRLAPLPEEAGEGEEVYRTGPDPDEE